MRKVLAIAATLLLAIAGSFLALAREEPRCIPNAPASVSYFTPEGLAGGVEVLVEHSCRKVVGVSPAEMAPVACVDNRDLTCYVTTAYAVVHVYDPGPQP